MTFTIPLFVGFGLIAALVLRQMPTRAAFLVAANLINLGFVWLFFGPFALAILLGIAALGLTLVRLGEVYGPRAIGPSLALIVILFVVIKQYPFVPRLDSLTSMGAVAGVSYIVFRLIHLVIDAAEKAAPRINSIEFLNFNLSFLTLLSGPITRHQDMEDWRAVETVRMHDLLRVAWGLLKVAALSPPIFALHQLLLDKGAAVSAAGKSDTSTLLQIDGGTLFAGAAWFVYLYFNFSGYMDIVIGLGRIAGVELPENFNRPFRANSFLQFWNRWHMTLSFWFRTYVFSPMFKMLYHRIPGWRAWHSHISLFLTFLLVGAWHGTTWSFPVCGLILGIGAVVNESYPKMMSHLIGKQPLKKINGHFAYQCVCFGLTFAFFSFAFIPFWMPEHSYFSFLHHFAHPAGPVVFIALWAGAMIYICAFRLAESVIVPVTQRLIDGVGAERVHAALLPVVANAILLAALLNYGQVQTFVYQTY
ncbi:MBOAT family O-acyltransferase [Sphingomonas sp. AR_OL41]|uniref:MBOAT family O-acyltransferase n=1 Tax=Sphingomonas sp. AR_OL41 TaxID=3042729 RepID=UPI00248106DF|nr:MBOAT family O-acyltransferase [Sphingomonas sp. AR_OL41]MDH7975770.1 MBOAT family O-acyltransferase [Sphingomonas sp. AR_OL41]